MVYLAHHSYRSVKNAVHAQDGRLRGVNDGCAKQGPKYTAITDCECASVHIFNGELIFTCLCERRLQ